MAIINKQLLIRLLPMFLIGFVIYVGAASNASAQGIINEILGRMDAHNKSLTSLKANVTMVKENAQLGGALDTTEGTAIYLPVRGKDPLVRIDWVSPKESLAVVNKQYVIYRPALSQAYTGNTDSAKGNAKAGGALAFMSMSRAQLKQNFSIKYLGEATVKGGTNTWHLELTPNARTSYKSAEVWVDGNGMPIQSKVVEHNNDATTVLLSNLQKNIRINTADFKVDLPKGTKIIKS
jgi:outer membrane lipoprotein-sorting protein